ncbi:MAG TPA: phosphoribosylamine--glycine ligase [Tissierellales bacterium]|nr:phosphoribosylamine--glycine ligase [Tissierellales bacterium]
MKVLVVGSGGREHALCWKIAKSEKVSKIYCAPGNGGTEDLAENVNINPSDLDSLGNFALENNIDLTVVGPEEPLVNGIVDKFKEKGLKIFGVNKKAAQLEGSKLYSKEFMEKYNIPTAKYKSCNTREEAINSLEEFNYPLVIKADGLCAGKGVLIVNTKEEALKAIDKIMGEKVFGEAGETVVIEEFLEGVECSLLCLVTKDKIIPLETARDYKKIFEKDKGANTGGVGCFSPNTILNKELEDIIREEVFENIKIGFEKENTDYRGIIFIGLMITERGPKVLEFNVRFGDPETEVILPRLKSDIVDIFEKTINGTLEKEDLKWREEKCATVVLTSKGYPSKYEKGKEIKGLEKLDKDIIVFHNRTKTENQKLYTNGGRVLSITALGNTIDLAIDKVYKNIEKINFNGMCFRNDIGN